MILRRQRRVIRRRGNATKKGAQTDEMHLRKVLQFLGKLAPQPVILEVFAVTLPRLSNALPTPFVHALESAWTIT